MFAGLLRIIMLFFAIYFIFGVLKRVFGFNKKNFYSRGDKKTGKRHDDNKIIELDKDQYKVE